MHSTIGRWSRGLTLAGIVLALVLVVPTAWFPFQLAKVAVFSICLLIAAVLFLFSGGSKELLRSHGLYGALLVGLLPLMYVLSLIFSVDRSVGIAGYGFEVDTLLFSVLAFLAFIFAFTFFRTLRTVRLLLTVVGVALVVAAIFQCISIVFGSAVIPLSTFADRSVNLVGKWNDLGLLIGLLVTFLLVRVELMYSSPLAKIAAVVGGAILLTLLAIINFPLVWILLLVFSLGIALVAFLTARGEHVAHDGPMHWRHLVPALPLVVAAISTVFLVYGSVFNVGLTSLFPVSSLEVRPSYDATNGILTEARGGSFSRLLVGTGPNTFGQEWILHKPTSVNQSQFWNLDFNIGFSTLLTAFGTVGLLGAIAWLMPVFLVLLGVLRAMRLSLLTREDRGTAVSIAVASLFLMGSIILYVPSANIVLLAFVLSGAAFGFFWRQGQSSSEVTADLHSPFASMVSVALVVVLVLLAAITGFVSSRRLIAEAFVGHGTVALGAGDVVKAQADSRAALKVEKTSDTLRFALAAGSAQLAKIAADRTSAPSDLQQQFADVLKQTIAQGQLAVAHNPHDYRPVFALAQIYDFLTGAKISGAVEQARAAYASAAVLNPTNPQIPLLRARLEANAGNGAEVQKQVTQSLTLKPNYTDAMLFVTQLAVANNDLNTAVQASQAAVQSAPGVPSLWFQLGLLLYTGKDTKDAVPVLEQAVKLQSDYANAKYFLGLSYYVQGNKDAAIQQFRDLAATNPGNAEVALLLANMQKGVQNPFQGAEPPANTPPQKRTTAPVQQ